MAVHGGRGGDGWAIGLADVEDGHAFESEHRRPAIGLAGRSSRSGSGAIRGRGGVVGAAAYERGEDDDAGFTACRPAFCHAPYPAMQVASGRCMPMSRVLPRE